MPEGDTVFRTAERLNRVFAGALITGTDIRVPAFATVDLSGQRSHGVGAHGKHLLHRIGDHTIHSHLRMEGRWDLLRTPAPLGGGRHRIRLIVETQGWRAVGRDLAMVKVVPREEEHRVIGHLGPDPLHEDWAQRGRHLAIAAIEGDERPVHIALLDQRHVAGFGNEYANELCFLRGVSPWTPAERVDAPELLDLGARLLRLNRSRTVRSTTGDLRRGMTSWVAFREGRACRRCGGVILRGSLGDDPTRQRDVYHCPRCQPDPE